MTDLSRKKGLIQNIRNILLTRNLYIFSHMRSRSSLLAHILGSNPGISGYNELHRSHNGLLDVFKFKANLAIDVGYTNKAIYSLDKILHNGLSVSRGVLESRRTKAIILIRDPEETIRSIMNMSEITGIEWYGDPTKALKYYKERIKFIANQISHENIDCYFIEAGDLMRNPVDLLSGLTDWLGLDVPLSSEYKINEKTGVPLYGDPSPNISAGRIIDTKPHSEVVVPSAIVEAGWDAYRECLPIYKARSING